MDARFRNIRRAVYALTRKFAQQIYLVQINNVAVNVSTGVQSADRISLSIPKAIVLPTKTLRRWMHANPDIAFKRDFAFGGSFDTRARAFIINRRIIPSTFTVDLNLEIIFKNRRWQPQIINEFEDDECVVIIAQELDGSPTIDVGTTNISISDQITPDENMGIS